MKKEHICETYHDKGNDVLKRQVKDIIKKHKLKGVDKESMLMMEDLMIELQGVWIKHIDILKAKEWTNEQYFYAYINYSSTVMTTYMARAVGKMREANVDVDEVFEKVLFMTQNVFKKFGLHATIESTELAPTRANLDS